MWSLTWVASSRGRPLTSDGGLSTVYGSSLRNTNPSTAVRTTGTYYNTVQQQQYYQVMILLIIVSRTDAVIALPLLSVLPLRGVVFWPTWYVSSLGGDERGAEVTEGPSPARCVLPVRIVSFQIMLTSKALYARCPPTTGGGRTQSSKPLAVFALSQRVVCQSTAAVRTGTGIYLQ